MSLFCFDATYSSGIVPVGLPSSLIAYMQQLGGAARPKTRIALDDGRIFETVEPLSQLADRLPAEKFIRFPASSGDAVIALTAIHLIEQINSAGPTTVHLLPRMKAPTFSSPQPLKALGL